MKSNKNGEKEERGGGGGGGGKRKREKGGIIGEKEGEMMGREGIEKVRVEGRGKKVGKKKTDHFEIHQTQCELFYSPIFLLLFPPFSSIIVFSSPLITYFLLHYIHYIHCYAILYSSPFLFSFLLSLFSLLIFHLIFFFFFLSIFISAILYAI